QTALNNAVPGDIISLQAGATFSGNFVLPNKAGSGWIVIRSSAPDSSLPPAGSRITPAYAGLMPKIISPNTAPAITTAMGAHHYRFIGVEISTTQSETSSTNYNLIWLEYAVNGMSQQTSLSQAPTDIIFDRVYIHGTPTGNVRRGLFMNSARTAVIDSYLSDFHEIGADTQAILICNGPGPFKITNNYLEGAGENFMSGGCDPLIPNLVPSDMEIRANHFFKPLKWRLGDASYAGIHWSVKNLFELKNAQRVLIDGNLFEHNWADAQTGIAIQFTPRNQDGGAPWAVVQDVTFTNNIVRHSGSAVNLLGWDNINSSQQLKRALIKNNLFEDISSSNWGGSGHLFQLLNGTADVVIDHNTGLHSGNIILADGAAHTGFVYQNNIMPHNLYGVIGTGTGVGSGTLSTYFPGSVFARNVVAGGSPSSYPADNFFPASLNEVGFLNLSAGDYHLSLSSPYNNAGTDGQDIGVDFDALLLATQGVIDGTAVNPPPPPDTTAPLISAVSTPLISSSTATVTWTTNESSDSQVEYGSTTAYGSSTPINSSMVSSHSQGLSGLNSNTLYHYRVKSKDAAGNLAVSTDSTFTTPAVADVSPPTVSITAPASGSTVSGTITVSASASDNVGVVGVQFKLDGVNLEAEDTTAHYVISWNTTTATNGSHTLTAVARDAAGNSATSAPIT
ncbi:hypothetical protein HY631_03680, partial [Candidatus Uhrbacteria bacterium]|nr:hypothetical protein [Candidatus Uhrbacteria bacterium]